jgi:DNA-binding transcriptional ArsR family regulator
MIDLTASAEKVRTMIHDAREAGDGFEVVCKKLGLDPKEIDEFVTELVGGLNGDSTLEGAAMNALLIGIAAERPEGIDWSWIGQAGMHATRRAILAYLTDNEIGSPNEISQATGEPLGNVSYHVKQLFNPDNREKNPSLIELVKTEPRRGAVEHFYGRRPQPVFLKEGQKP